MSIILNTCPIALATRIREALFGNDLVDLETISYNFDKVIRQYDAGESCEFAIIKSLSGYLDIEQNFQHIDFILSALSQMRRSVVSAYINDVQVLFDRIPLTQSSANSLFYVARVHSLNLGVSHSQKISEEDISSV